MKTSEIFGIVVRSVAPRMAKVTIIYGKNGDGKTTLHQLFQWIFYGQVHFNKTTTDRLYNHQYECDQPIGATFDVFGCIDFEHELVLLEDGLECYIIIMPHPPTADYLC